MTQVHFEISSGGGEIDTRKLVIGTDGFIGLRQDGVVVPLAYDAQRAALERHFGGLWRDALMHVTALHDG